MSKPVVVSKKQFESLGKVVRGEDIWTVDTSAITNLDGRGAVQISDTPADHAASEKGKGMIEWLMGTALVALGVLATFILFAPRFIDAFNAQITAMIP
jgi:hypothetical protein